MAYDVKFYFESDGPASMVAVGAAWEQYRTGEYGSLTTVKANSAHTAVTWEINSSSEPWDLCLRQLVSASQAAREWTTADTFDIAVKCYQNNNALDASLYVVIRVLSSDLATVRGVLYAGEVNNVEWDADAFYQRRHADGIAIQNAVTQQLNDKIVVELGARCLYTGATHIPRIYTGSDNAADLALSDANDYTGTENGWIAFTYGASGITLPLTGVSGTASVGAVALSLALALSGLVGTGAVGTLAPALDMTVAGIEAPASPGTMTPDMAAIAAGIEALGEVGTVGQSVTVSLTGVAATGEAGTASPGNAVSASGVSTGMTYPLNGVQATGAVGNVAAEVGVGSDITIPITGVSAGPAYPLSGVAAAGAVGTVTAVEASDITLPLTGISGTGAVGGVVYLTLGGWAATGEIGTVTPSVSPPVTGNEATAAVGGVGLDRSVGLTGAGASGEVGGWNVIARPITGNVAAGEVGTVTPRIAPPISGNLGMTGIGDVVQAHGLGLTGVPGVGVAGYMDHFVEGDIVIPLTGIAVTASVGTLTCGVAVPTYIHVSPRKRILDVRPRKRILDVFRRRT